MPVASQDAILVVEGVVPLIFGRMLGNVGPNLAYGIELVGGNIQCFRRMCIYVHLLCVSLRVCCL